MAKPLSTTESPSSFIRYKDGYSEHTSGFTVCRDSEIKKSYHTLREKITKKRQPLSDSVLTLTDQRHALLFSTEIKEKKREKEKTGNSSWYH